MSLLSPSSIHIQHGFTRHGIVLEARQSVSQDPSTCITGERKVIGLLETPL